MRGVAPAGSAENEAADEVVGVGRHRDSGGVGQSQQRGNARCTRGISAPTTVSHFVSARPRGIFECRGGSRGARVRPEMMAVRGEMNARRIGATKFG